MADGRGGVKRDLRPWPRRLNAEAGLGAHGLETLISSEDVETDGMLQLTQADGAEAARNARRYAAT